MSGMRQRRGQQDDGHAHVKTTALNGHHSGLSGVEKDQADWVELERDGERVPEPSHTNGNDTGPHKPAPQPGISSTHPPAQPRFATLTLPPSYDHLPLTTRLWLQSRLLGVDAQGKCEFRDQGLRRPMTLANLLIALDLWRLILPRIPRLTNSTLALKAAVHLFRSMVSGLAPMGRLWAASQLLDLVGRSLRGGPVPWSEALQTAGVSVAATSAKHFLDLFLTSNSRSLRSMMSFSAQEACIKAYLVVNTAKLNSPMWDALLFEAGKFVGWEPDMAQDWQEAVSSPFDMLAGATEVLGRIIAVTGQMWLLASALAAADGLWSWTSVILLTVAVIPALMPFVQDYASNMVVEDFRKAFQYERAEKEIRKIAKEDQYKNEAILFGLGEWTHAKWYAAKTQVVRRTTIRESFSHAVDFAASITRETSSSAAYVLLATGVISSRITLGTLHLYQSASTSLSTSFYFLWGGVRRSFQAVFVCAAFCAVIEPPPRQGGIDYETRRTGGMRIQARGLAYTYPGSSDQVLHDINITVEPGQTLAIVGFNGGGKTTLVKLFMGLFTEYTGSLTINGVEIRDYDDTTLHTRTGCLFQDYARYPTTLAENVGVGDTTRMGDMAAVRRATERGGADEVARLVGERQLKPGGVGKDEGWGVDDDDDDDMANLAAQNSDAFVALCGSGPASSWAERKGIGLSGGQWQRIALARAFMRSDRSDLVVFDEPSASLDPRAEAELFDRIHALSGKELGSRSRRSETSSAPSTPQTATPAPTPTSGDGPTTVYISHRFSTVRRADVIAFVEGGTIVECGTHAQLMARQGRYHELFTLQRDGFEAD